MMIEKDMENEFIQGFKEISQYSNEFEEPTKSTVGLNSILTLIVGLGLFFGILCGISLLFKK